MPIRDRRPTFSNGTVFYARFTTSWEGANSIVIIKIAQKSTFIPETLSVLATLNDERDRLPEGSLGIKTVDNDDPLKPIKAKQATIKFFSGNYSLKSFAKGESDEWLVQIYLDVEDANHLLFKGFLVMDVATEPYEPKPYEVILTATDNLGLLKNIPLTDFDGNNPKNENKIIKYIAWALSKTNMALPIYVSNNLTEENNPGVPFYESCYLHAKTFEKEIGESIDCYTALEYILGNNSRIMQRNGAWWIESIYEKNANPAYVHQFAYDGTYVGVAAPAFYKETVDFRGLIDFVNDNAQVTIKSPYDKAELTYKYEYPKEILDNIDFSRVGSLYFPLSMANEVLEGVSYYVRKYHLVDWVLEKQGGGTNQIDAYFKMLYQDLNLTYEKERYLVLSDGQTTQHWVKSNPIEIHQKDKLEISLDRRLPNRWGGSSDIAEVFAQVRLYGDDGTFWTFGQAIDSPDAEGKWKRTSDATFTNPPVSYIDAFYNTADIQNNDWQNVSAKSAPAPVSGKVYVLLYAAHLESPYRTRETHFNNVRLTYIPYINGAYSKYTGQKNTVSQSGTYALSYKQQIYISDSPKKLFKGALLRKVGSDYLLAGKFYDGQAFPSGVPSSDYLHPFGYQLVYSIWQLYRRHMTSIDSDMVGLKCSSPFTVPDLYKSFLFINPNPHVDNKYFMLLHYEQDFDTQIWRAYFTEILDTTVGYVFTDPYEFKYITG